MEALRLFPPAYGLTRSCSQDSEFNGIPIPGGADMVLSIYGIQRDERTWPAADEFDPNRFLKEWPQNGFIPFGMGRHICIGMRFSILESMLILACIGQRYRLAPADQQVVKPEVGVTLLPDRAIRLQLLPARSAAET